MIVVVVLFVSLLGRAGQEDFYQTYARTKVQTKVIFLPSFGLHETQEKKYEVCREKR